MGIIQRQSIKGSIYSYIGAFLGFVNLAILAPKIFTTDQIGLTQVLVSVATIFAQMGTLGFNSVTSRLFPYFRSKEDHHHGFLRIQSLVGAVGFLVVLLLYFLLRGYLVEKNVEKSALFTQYIDLLIPLMLFLLAHTLMDSYNRILYNATLGTFLREVLVRLGNFGLIMLFWQDVISFQTYVYLFVATLGVPPALITVYLYLTGELSLKSHRGYISRDLRKQMIDVAVFGIIAGMSGIALVNIDKYMVTQLLGLSNTGIYSIAFYFGTLVLLPSRALTKISVTLLAQAWKDEERGQIDSIYKKSCLNQFIVGGLLFILLAGNLENIFQILPDAYADGRWTIIFIGLANVLNMMSGVSMHVIGTSAHYRYQNYWMILFIILVVITNLVFIPLFGITGAALASLISTSLFTFVKFMFLKWKFGFQPYSYAFLIIALITAGSLGISLLVPPLSFWPDLFLRSSMIVLVFSAAIYLSGVSKEVNSIANGIFRFLGIGGKGTR
jgi:O-antigen/teichoic acid export membrane protein